MTTRAEHLAWCKSRALEYVERGDYVQAWGSMVSDLGKHPETAGHGAIKLGSSLMFNGYLNTAAEVREFIEGFR